MSKATTVERGTPSTLHILLAPVSKATSVKLPVFSSYLPFCPSKASSSTPYTQFSYLETPCFLSKTGSKHTWQCQENLPPFGTFRGARGKQTSFNLTPSSARACRESWIRISQDNEKLAREGYLDVCREISPCHLWQHPFLFPGHTVCVPLHRDCANKIKKMKFAFTPPYIQRNVQGSSSIFFLLLELLVIPWTFANFSYVWY